MKLNPIKLLLVLIICVGTIRAACPVSEKPQDVIECLSYITTGAYGIAVRDLKKICRIATDITRCIRDQLGDCIAKEIGTGVLNEIETVSRNCCPDSNVPACPYRESNMQEQRCFSADSLVTLNDGQTKTVEQLRSGDVVLAFDQNTKTVRPSRVFTMLDYQPQRLALFKQITTVSGRQLSLSSSHLVLTPTNDYVMAKDIRVGMEIFVLDNGDELVYERISNVSEVVKQGYVAPLTEEGTIIVNNVAASCYATIKSHNVAHAVLSPLRWWYQLLGAEQSSTESMQQGVHWFPKMIYDVTAFVLPSIIHQ